MNAQAQQQSTEAEEAPFGQRQEIEAMVTALFEEDEDDDEEIKQLQDEVRSLSAKAQHFQAQGPTLIGSRLQHYLQERRPRFSLDSDDAADAELLDLMKDDSAIAQATMLKAQVAALKADIPMLLQRMKDCLEACERKQRLAEERRPPLPGFLQEVHKVWEALSPARR